MDVFLLCKVPGNYEKFSIHASLDSALHEAYKDNVVQVYENTDESGEIISWHLGSRWFPYAVIKEMEIKDLTPEQNQVAIEEA